jgi:hypothetical protein
MDETWMVFLLPETGLSLTALTGMAAESGLRTKETCFGAIVEGPPGDVRKFLAGLKQLFPVYLKRRAFSIGDTEICASTFRRPADESLPPWLPRYAGQIRRYTS